MPGQVQVNAPQELFIGGQRGGHHAHRFHLVEDLDVDEIAPGHLAGRAFYPSKKTDLEAAFQEIEQELRSQYLIAYSSTNKQRDGKFRSLKIEVTNPTLTKDKLSLRYRPGYFAREN